MTWTRMSLLSPVVFFGGGGDGRFLGVSFMELETR